MRFDRAHWLKVTVLTGLCLASPAAVGTSWAQTFASINSFAGCDVDGCQAGTDGARPGGTLVVGPDGNFYGTTFAFPGQGFGTIYRITPAGVRTTLVNFDEPTDPPGVVGPWGCYPIGRLAIGPDGFYGVTDQCGLHG